MSFIKTDLGNRIKNYAGIKNNSLVAIKYIKTVKNKTYWLFKCDCGKEKILKTNKVYNKHKPIKSCGCSKTNKNYAFIKLINSYKRGALSRGFVFDLKDEEFKSITSSSCHYCGVEPQRLSKSTNDVYLYNGIDRKFNEVGYVFYNCLPCCTLCNKAKRDLDYNLFIKWIERLSIYRTTKKTS